jgi:hypothetical protein
LSSVTTRKPWVCARMCWRVSTLSQLSAVGTKSVDGTEPCLIAGKRCATRLAFAKDRFALYEIAFHHGFPALYILLDPIAAAHHQIGEAHGVRERERRGSMHLRGTGRVEHDDATRIEHRPREAQELHREHVGGE